ncbi:hypothetical protein DP116_25155 [Brasilonema bromeliae SPC951]|uniref:Uncharacterized protein n=1 Tax=Brasilonema bromeliae SPC951 TaxID=385972 RepID=A0ABX1PDJ1_9CYAN|nr:hypothetical protein [Brasilonema bromeliae SPC951]
MLSISSKDNHTNKILKKPELHFFLEKNDILYTELNFAIFWSSAPLSAPDFQNQNFSSGSALGIISSAFEYKVKNRKKR